MSKKLLAIAVLLNLSVYADSPDIIVGIWWGDLNRPSLRFEKYQRQNTSTHVFMIVKKRNSQLYSLLIETHGEPAYFPEVLIYCKKKDLCDIKNLKNKKQIGRVQIDTANNLRIIIPISFTNLEGKPKVEDFFPVGGILSRTSRNEPLRVFEVLESIRAETGWDIDE